MKHLGHVCHHHLNGKHLGHVPHHNLNSKHIAKVVRRVVSFESDGTLDKVADEIKYHT
jgi:hypothetical protein